jgi:hypothetical protein
MVSLRIESIRIRPSGSKATCQPATGGSQPWPCSVRPPTVLVDAPLPLDPSVRVVVRRPPAPLSVTMNST